MRRRIAKPYVTVDFVTDIKEITQDILGNTFIKGAELTKKSMKYRRLQEISKIESYQDIGKTYVCRK